LSKRTLGRYKQTQKVFIDFLGEDCEVVNIDQTIVEDFVLYLLDKEDAHTDTGKFALSTINSHLRGLKAIWHWGHEESGNPPLLTSNPLVKIKSIKEVQTIPRFFTPHEFLQLMEATKQDPSRLARARNRAILLTLYDCGLRAEELCGLKLENFSDNTIKPDYDASLNIDDLLWQPAGIINVSAVSAKGSKERSVPTSPATVQAIASWRKELSLELEENPTGASVLPWLFCSWDIQGKFSRLSTRSLHLLCARLGDRVGLRCYPHKLRHSFAMFVINSNPEERGALQKLLGHSSSRMTDHYARLLSKSTARVHAKNSPVSKLMSGDARKRAEALNSMVM
jgi:integrase/recombinase XerD